MTKTQTEKAEARETLLGMLKPGDTVYTVLESVSRSGMSRQIRVVVPYVRHEVLIDGRWQERTDDNAKAYDAQLNLGFVAREIIEHWHPNYSVATLLGLRRAKKGDGVIVGGCGMDMGFALVYELSQALFGGRLVRDIYLDSATHDEDGPRGQLLTRDGAPADHVYLGGYKCLGKGACPSNYHTNHRARVRCEGTRVHNPEGTDFGSFCWRPNSWRGEEIPKDWPRSAPIDMGKGEKIPGPALSVVQTPETEGGTGTYIVCPTCHGVGDLPNPEGPERFDLVHTDGYALRHRWL